MDRKYVESVFKIGREILEGKDEIISLFNAFLGLSFFNFCTKIKFCLLFPSHFFIIAQNFLPWFQISFLGRQGRKYVLVRCSFWLDLFQLLYKNQILSTLSVVFFYHCKKTFNKFQQGFK